MATNYNATAKAAETGTARLNGSAVYGSLRVFTSTYTVVASSEPIVGDTITWGTIPAGSQIIGSLSNLNCAVGTAATTLNLGIVGDATELLSASSVATAQVHALTAKNADGAVYTLTDPMELVSVVAGDTLLAGQVITLRIVYVQN